MPSNFTISVLYNIKFDFMPVFALGASLPSSTAGGVTGVTGVTGAVFAFSVIFTFIDLTA